jgi:ABC-2 type transport system permease protein
MKLFSTIGVICRNTIAVWWRHPSLIAASVLPPLLFLAVGWVGAEAVAHAPIALVTLDQGPKGQQMAHILHHADIFRVIDATPQQARVLINSIQVAGIITIPADFTSRAARHESAPIAMEINNLNLDFTADIRRAVPDAITQFYAAQGTTNPMRVTMHATNTRARDIELFQYEVLPVLSLMILVSGLVNTAVSIAREYETRTFKEILLSPASNREIVGGKILAGFLIGLSAGLLELGLSIALDWLSLDGWMECLITLLLLAGVALFAASVGFLLGSWMQRIQSAHALATNATLFFFFLAGGVGVLAFEPPWLQTVAAFLPLTYANHALQMVLLYHSSDLLGRDVAILSISILLPLFLDFSIIRRDNA